MQGGAVIMMPFWKYGDAPSTVEDGDEQESEVVIDETEEDDHEDEGRLSRLAASFNNDRPKSWNEAHDRYCHKHGRLRATIQQVLDEFYGRITDDDEGYEMPWSLPARHTVVLSNDYAKLDSAQIDTKIQREESSPTSSSASTALQLAKRLAGGIYSSVLQLAGQSENDEVWAEPDDEDDDFAAMNRAAAHSGLDLNEEIVNKKLTRQCLSSVLETSSSAEEDSSSSISYRRDPWRILTQPEWAKELRKITNESMIQNLSLDDSKWLLQVLVAQHYARILPQDHKADAVVLRTDGARLATTEVGKKQELESLQTPLALFELQQSIQSMERRLEQWASQAHACSEKALASKKQGQTRLAMAQLSRRKRLQQQIDMSTNTLLQLEQVHTAIETAHSNKDVLQLLSKGSKLLHKLSDETKIDAIDEVQDEMQDALDQMQEQEDMIQSFSGKGTNVSDDDLLAELAALTIQDTTEKEQQTAPMVTETANDATAITTDKAKDESIREEADGDAAVSTL